MYKANHYTRINGVKYRPGEYINGEIPEDKLERLIQRGAVQIVTAPAPEKIREESEEPEPAKTEVVYTVTEQEEEPEEDAPEIDVMAGIVKEEPEEPEEPKKPARTRKTAERRKKS